MKTKAVVAQLKDQLEFYFSDSNLWKDKFLRCEISKSSERYVQVSVLASFKRMKQLTTDIELVIQAIRESDKLELNDKCSGVRRVTPLAAEQNVDDLTIYVEQLPENVDHDMLRRTFSVFGGVNYVSLPRFKLTRKIKGFAFIEFDTTVAAKRAAEAFSDQAVQSGEKCVDEESHTERGEAADLDDVKLPTASSDKTSRKRKREASAEDTGDASVEEAENDTVQKGRKRRHHDRPEDLSGEDDGPGPPPCKRKSHGSEIKTESDAKNEETAERDSKRKKHTRSHTKSRRKKVKQAFGDWRPRILLKSDWMEAKKEYKRLQQEQMGRLKQEIRKMREQNIVPHKTSRPTRPTILFKPAVVVRFSWPDNTSTSNWTALSLRELFARHGNVAFVDFQANSLSGYVRFAEVEDCQRALASLCPTLQNAQFSDTSTSQLSCSEEALCNPPTAFNLLQGDEEMAYWKKVESDQQKKYTGDKEKKSNLAEQNVHKEKNRGREKLMQKALKIGLHGQSEGQHLHFDDEDDDAERTDASSSQSKHIHFDSSDDDHSDRDQ